MSTEDGCTDEKFMRRALELAALGSGSVAPNPMVGAVVVNNGRIVGEGFHKEFGGPHAEVHALQAAGDLARGSTVFVNLEPCNHHGRTPPCTDALLAAGVSRVVCAIRDPNPKAAGGLERLAASGIVVESGLCEREAELLNAVFLHDARSQSEPEEKRIPFVALKLAVSLDGAIAGPNRHREQLTGPQAIDAVHRMRAGFDAIGVGIGTVLADDPLLTVRHGPAPRVAPLRVVFDSHCRLPLNSALVRTASEVRVTIMASAPLPEAARALKRAGVSVLAADSAHQALVELRRQGIRSILIEGGAGLASGLLTDGLVHHLIIFQAPVILGKGALPAFAEYPAVEAVMAPRYRVLERLEYGADQMTRYAVSGD